LPYYTFAYSDGRWDETKKRGGRRSYDLAGCGCLNHWFFFGLALHSALLGEYLL